MRLYLVQHGQAKSEELDPQRGLTEQGIQDVERLAAFLRPLSLAVQVVWHSGKTRAAQTAQILAPVPAGKPEVVQQKGLAPNDPVELIEAKLGQAQNDLMIVGHLPFLDRLASKLVAGKETAKVCAFQQGGLVCLQRAEDNTWSVCWMVIPELLNATGAR